MSETFTYKCENCGELEVPEEYRGMQAECTECSVTFTLPTLEAETVEPEVTEDQNPMEATGTVKIDRSTIGMIPDVADQFKLDFETTDSNKNIQLPEEDVADYDYTSQTQKKWWQFWK